MNSILLLLPIVLSVAGSAFAYVLPFSSRKARNRFALAFTLATALSVWALILFPPSEPLVILEFADRLTFSLQLDGAGRLFAGLSATLWPVTLIYAFSYMEKEEHIPMFYLFFGMSFGVTYGVAASANILTMYLFYELLTLATLPLVMHGMTHRSRAAARKYMIFSFGGAAFAFAGVVYLISRGAMDFAPGGVLSSADGLTEILFLFAFFGFGVKAAIFPLHGWLPTAAVAPTPVTALLHAVAVVKAGAFAVIRLIYYSFGTDLLAGTAAQTAILVFCLFTILFGSVTALKQTHLKRRLAYSTISNLSYILFAAALMTDAGLVASFAHLISHSLVKIAAFFAAGEILHRTGKEYISDLDGLGRRMPLTFLTFTVCGLGLAGMPLTCGFISKWAIASAALREGSLLAVLGVATLLISALLTAIYMLSVSVRAYFRAGNQDTAILPDDDRMRIPMLCLSLVSVLFFVFGGNYLDLIAKEVAVLWQAI